MSNLINCLSSDLDTQQDLWVHYLDNNLDHASLVSYIEKINKEFDIDIELQHQLWDAAKNPPSDRFYELLSRFSAVERSVACLLSLGLSVAQISDYKGISEVRIRQVMHAIRYNSAWNELYGI